MKTPIIKFLVLCLLPFMTATTAGANQLPPRCVGFVEKARQSDRAAGRVRAGNYYQQVQKACVCMSRKADEAIRLGQIKKPQKTWSQRRRDEEAEALTRFYIGIWGTCYKKFGIFDQSTP